MGFAIFGRKMFAELSQLSFLTFPFLVMGSSLRKDSIAEPFYGLIGEVFELKGGKCDEFQHAGYLFLYGYSDLVFNLIFLRKNILGGKIK